jgi:phage-related holin
MKRMVVTGFIIWLIATIALRLGGQYVFGHVSALLLLLMTLPVMAFVTRVLLQRYVTIEQRALAAVALVAPGMLLDTISAVWFPAIFPNIRAGCSGLFGGWLLFCNVVVLLTAVWYRPSPRAA